MSDTERFEELISWGKTTSQAMKQLEQEAFEPRPASFWKAEHKRIEREVAELIRTTDECTGPDGEIYGHRD